MKRIKTYLRNNLNIKKDKVANFDLTNGFLLTIYISFLTPLLVSFQGLYIIPVMISIFMLVRTFVIKSHVYILKSMKPVGILKVIVSLLLLQGLSLLLYFIDETLMIYTITSLSILTVPFYISYDIKLDGYFAKKIGIIEEYKSKTASLSADSTIIGLLLFAVLSFSNEVMILFGLFLIICITIFIYKRIDIVKEV